MLYNKPPQISVGCHNEHLFHGCVTGGQGGSARLGSRIQAVPRSGPHVSDVFGPMATWGMLFGWQKTEAQGDKTKHASLF